MNLFPLHKPENNQRAAGGWSRACSARPACGNRGPAFESRAGVCRWGLAQLLDHEPEAYFFESHIFTQPLRSFDSAQGQ
jgi:hypothetical protein